jgi:hypothetical protein
MIVYMATCNVCNSPIPVTKAELDSGFDLAIEVEPCKECLEAAAVDAKSDGHSEGYDKGKEDGISEANADAENGA